MDLHEFLRILWKRRLAMVSAVLVTTAAGIAFGKLRQPVYESTSTVAITPRSAKVGFISADSLSPLLGTYAQTAESDVVKGAAERNVGHPLSGTVSASAQAGTGILQISASSSSQAQAQVTADAVTRAFLDRISNVKLVRADIVNPAQTPTTPVQPRMPLIVGASIVVGLGVAVLLALGLERFRARIETAEDVAEVVQAPLLAHIPRRRELLRSNPRVVWDEPGWVDIRESFRSLRTNLQFVEGEHDRVIQITSPSANPGKSTLVANLGVAFARVGVRTVIVDADLRRPMQHRIFDVDNRRTVWSSTAEASESAAKRASGTVRPGESNPTGAMARWARATQYSALAVVAAHEHVRYPTELLHVRFARLIGELKAAYDLVLVDTPAVLPVSDAVITAAQVDAVLLVVTAGSERPAALRQAVASIELSGTSLAGIVLYQTTESRPGGGRNYQQAAIPIPEDELRARVARAGADRSRERARAR